MITSTTTPILPQAIITLRNVPREWSWVRCVATCSGLSWLWRHYPMNPHLWILWLLWQIQEH